MEVMSRRYDVIDSLYNQTQNMLDQCLQGSINTQNELKSVTIDLVLARKLNAVAEEESVTVRKLFQKSEDENTALKIDLGLTKASLKRAKTERNFAIGGLLVLVVGLVLVN